MKRDEVSPRARRTYRSLLRYRSVRILVLVIVNLVIFLVLLLAAELGYRIHRDGFEGAIAGLLDPVPYSNLGTSNWMIYDEDLGFRLNPDREGTNALSIRHEEVATPKPEGVCRIVFLGDSVTWPDDGFVTIVRQALEPRARFEVINAGVPGYTSYQEVLFYEKHLASTTPDLVVWVYCLNDNHRFLHRFDENASMLWTREAERALRVDSLWDEIVSRSYLLTRLRVALASPTAEEDERPGRFEWENQVAFHTAWKDESWADYHEQLRTLKRLLARQGARLAIVVVPYEPQLGFSPSDEDSEYVSKPQRKLRAVSAGEGVPCLDLLPGFAGSRLASKGLYLDAIHLSEEGHRLAAREILRFLAEERLVPTDRGGPSGD